MAKIGIDARFYGSIGKGLGRYTQKLIEQLELIDQENEYVIFLRQENFGEYTPLNPNFQKVLADFRWYSFSEQLRFPRLIKQHKLDLMHFPHFNVPLLQQGKFVMTIHDLILLHFPTVKGTTLNPFWYWIKFAAYKLNINIAVKRAAKIITVSNFTKGDLEAHYPKQQTKLAVTYEACDNHCHITKDNYQHVLEKYGIINSYLLYVGNAYPHKNLECLLEAFELISQTNPQLQLVLVGKEDYFYARLRKLAQERKIQRVLFLGFVPDEELDVIYRFAACYVFPSLYEGFGLPPLEAMAKGCPVISSDHACMQEILGPAAFYVEARSSKALAQGVQKLLSSPQLRSNLIERGYHQIGLYSWQRMATETLAIYSALIRGNKN